MGAEGRRRDRAFARALVWALAGLLVAGTGLWAWRAASGARAQWRAARLELEAARRVVANGELARALRHLGEVEGEVGRVRAALAQGPEAFDRALVATLQRLELEPVRLGAWGPLSPPAQRRDRRPPPAALRWQPERGRARVRSLVVRGPFGGVVSLLASLARWPDVVGVQRLQIAAAERGVEAQLTLVRVELDDAPTAVADDGGAKR